MNWLIKTLFSRIFCTTFWSLKLSSNQFYCPFFDKNVAFTKFLPKNFVLRVLKFGFTKNMHANVKSYLELNVTFVLSDTILYNKFAKSFFSKACTEVKECFSYDILRLVWMFGFQLQLIFAGYDCQLDQVQSLGQNGDRQPRFSELLLLKIHKLYR